MDNNTQLTKKQIFLSRLILSISMVLLGLFLLFCGLDIIKIPILKAILPALLTALAATCFFWAFIQDNTLMLYLAPIFVLVAAVSILAAVTKLGYQNLYPLYIFSPMVSSCITPIYSKKWQDHLKVILFFGISGIIFSLNGIFDVGLKIVIPLFILFLGISIAAYSITHKQK